MSRLWRKKVLALVALLLVVWICVAAHLHVLYTDDAALKLPLQWVQSKLPRGESGTFLPLNVSYQLLCGSEPRQQKFLAVGLASVQRKRDLYLRSTLESIFSQSSQDEQAQMVVVVLVADFDERWRRFVTAEIQKSFPTELERGQLLLIHVPPEFYPPLTGLKRNYNDGADRVTFRSKQNVDYAFLVHFCASLGRYYLQLEDDVSSAKNFLTKIRTHIAEQDAAPGTWATLEFSSLGYIGKLYKAADLPALARFLFLFYQEMPCDWLLARFRDLLSQNKPIIFRPSLFQHMGTISSFRGTYNNLKDKDFEDGSYENPAADVFTTMAVYQKHFARLAWTPGEGFFWARSPAAGDHVTVVLKRPAVLSGVLIETGDGGKDALRSARVEIGKGVVAVGSGGRSCQAFVPVGQMQTGKFETQELDRKHNVSSSCLRIVVTAGQSDWLMVRRIRVKTKPDSTQKL